MFRFCVKSFGALFIGVGMLMIFTPVGGLLLLLGAAMLAFCATISLSGHAGHGITRATGGIVSRFR